MTEDIITIVVKAVFALIGVIMTYYVCPLINSYMQKSWVKIAVEAAEKMYQESGMGARKYEYVVTFLYKLKLFKIDESGNPPTFWRTLIEATVKELDIAEKNWLNK